MRIACNALCARGGCFVELHIVCVCVHIEFPTALNLNCFCTCIKIKLFVTVQSNYTHIHKNSLNIFIVKMRSAQRYGWVCVEIVAPNDNAVLRAIYFFI